MLRKLAKTGAAIGIHKLGVDRLVGVGRRLQHVPLVLSYHRVVENYQRSATHSISPNSTAAASITRRSVLRPRSVRGVLSLLNSAAVSMSAALPHPQTRMPYGDLKRNSPVNLNIDSSFI